ncbi:hypothetical protein [Sinomonas sp. P47F7]|uniref:hypothetical protein n=1 Tax=Sinomonas sp. P47F7 TaxID=3410987 RepID=UPI003BF60DBA
MGRKRIDTEALIRRLAPEVSSVAPELTPGSAEWAESVDAAMEEGYAPARIADLDAMRNQAAAAPVRGLVAPGASRTTWVQLRCGGSGVTEGWLVALTPAPTVLVTVKGGTVVELDQPLPYSCAHGDTTVSVPTLLRAVLGTLAHRDSRSKSIDIHRRVG